MEKTYFRSAKKTRVSFWIPCILNDRLNTDSIVYGVTKSAIIINALAQYYKNFDVSACSLSSGKPAPGAGETP